jgi:hypothetical protein
LYTSIGSNGSAISPDGFYKAMHPHPRWYGTFARFLGQYVREMKTLTLPEAVCSSFTIAVTPRNGWGWGLRTERKQVSISIDIQVGSA